MEYIISHILFFYLSNDHYCIDESIAIFHKTIEDQNAADVCESFLSLTFFQKIKEYYPLIVQ